MHRAIGGHRNSWVDRLSTQMIHNIDGRIGRQADGRADTGSVPYTVCGMIRSLTQLCRCATDWNWSQDLSEESIFEDARRVSGQPHYCGQSSSRQRAGHSPAAPAAIGPASAGTLGDCSGGGGDKRGALPQLQYFLNFAASCAPEPC